MTSKDMIYGITGHSWTLGMKLLGESTWIQGAASERVTCAFRLGVAGTPAPTLTGPSSGDRTVQMMDAVDAGAQR